MSLSRPENTHEARLAIAQYLEDIIADLGGFDDEKGSTPQEIEDEEEAASEMVDVLIEGLGLEVLSVSPPGPGDVTIECRITLPPAQE